MKYSKVGEYSPTSAGFHLPSRTTYCPTGFTCFFINTKKWYQCNTHNEAEQQCRIQISADRWKKLSEQEKFEVSTHEHIFPLMLETSEPDPATPYLGYVTSLPLLEKDMLIFAGKNKVSISAITSSSFQKLIQDAISIGQSNPSINCTSLFHCKSRKTITKDFVNMSSFIFHQQIDSYRKLKYVGISIDAGTLNHISYLDVIISNAMSNLKPLPFKTFTNFGGGVEDYIESIADVINSITELDLIPTGIVGDNLKVQWAAFLQAMKQFPGIYPVSCGCHSLNLGLQDYVGANSVINEMIEHLQSFAHLFGSKPVTSRFRKACPQFCPTRWTIYTDIAQWIILHGYSILSFVCEELGNIEGLIDNVELIIQVLFQDAPVIFILFSAFKCLSQKLESDRTSMCELFGYEFSSFAYAIEYASHTEATRERIGELIKFIKNRLESSRSGAVQYALFLLTIDGRMTYRTYMDIPDAFPSEICQKFKLDTETIEPVVETGMNVLTEQKYTCDDDEISYDSFIWTIEQIIENPKEASDEPHSSDDPMPSQADDQQSSTEFTTDQSSNPISSSDCSQETEIQTDSGTTSDSLTSTEYPSSEEEEDFTEYSSSSTSDDENDDSFREVELSDDKAIFTAVKDQETIIKTISELAQQCGMDPDKAKSQFIHWMSNEEITNMLSSLECTSYEFWKFHQGDKKIGLISDLFMRYSAIPCSEAACERLLSHQKKFMTREFSHTSPNLGAAKLIFSVMGEDDLRKKIGLE